MRSLRVLIPILLLWVALNGPLLAWGEDSIFIENTSAIASDDGIEHSATFTSLLDTPITFDALIRLDSQDEVLELDVRTITLGPGDSITIEGIFDVTRPGSYVIRWESLSPPPGEALAAGQQVTIEIIEEERKPPPVDPEEPVDPIEEGPAEDNPREDEALADPGLQEPADPAVEEPPPADPAVEEPPPADPAVEVPDRVIDEPVADPSPLDPEVFLPPIDPMVPPAPDAQVEEERARDEDAPVGENAPVIPPQVGEELPVISPPAPPAPAPPPQLLGNPEEEAVNSSFNTILIIAIGVVVWASIMGIILRRRSQNWKHEPLFTDE